jgi:hypothetical protein
MKIIYPSWIKDEGFILEYKRTGYCRKEKLLIELVNKHNFDCVCLQETIKSTFRQRDLERFAG